MSVACPASPGVHPEAASLKLPAQAWASRLAQPLASELKDVKCKVRPWVILFHRVAVLLQVELHIEIDGAPCWGSLPGWPW